MCSSFQELLLPGLGTILSVEAVGVVAVGGTVAGLVGGNDDTDWACAVAATATSNPAPKTVDLSKLFITNSPIKARNLCAFLYLC